MVGARLSWRRSLSATAAVKQPACRGREIQLVVTKTAQWYKVGMKLHDFILKKNIRARMSDFRPDEPRIIGSPMRVKPRSLRYALVGSAFDYLFRFEIARRVPVIESRWIADHVAYGDSSRFFSPITNEIREFCQSRPDFNIDDFRDDKEHSRSVKKNGLTLCNVVTDPFEIYFLRAARKVVDEAHSDIAAYREMRRPSVGEQKQAAFHAVRLAKVDLIFRVALMDPTFEDADRDDIAELVELLTIVPWEQLPGSDPPILNPALGGQALGIGADADLISGDCLTEVKTTKNTSMSAEYLDQLLGYLILSRYRRQTNGTFPNVGRLGLYFARHGYFWVRDARVWTDRPGFAEFEHWFLSQMPGM